MLIVTLKFSPLTPPPRRMGWGGSNKKYRFSWVHEMCAIWNFYPLKLPTPGGVGWGGVNFFITFLGSSWHFPDFWFFWPTKIPTATPFGGGGGNFVIDFLDISWNLPDFWNFDPQPPRVGWVKRNKFYWLSGQFMTFPVLLIFWPPKIPTSTPPLGWGGPFF